MANDWLDRFLPSQDVNDILLSNVISRAPVFPTLPSRGDFLQSEKDTSPFEYERAAVLPFGVNPYTGKAKAGVMPGMIHSAIEGVRALPGKVASDYRQFQSDTTPFDAAKFHAEGDRPIDHLIEGFAHSAVNGLTAPSRALSGTLPMWEYDPKTGDTHTSDAAIQAGLDATLGAATGGGMAARPANSAGVFAGRVAAENLAAKGETRPLEAMNLAKVLKAKGADPYAIYERTNKVLEGTPYAGVHHGADGLPRFEIADNAMTLSPGKEGVWPGRFSGTQNGVTGPHLSHDTLGGAYPEMSDMPFRFSSKPNQPTSGATHAKTGAIEVRGGTETSYPYRPTPDEDALLNASAHELQHRVQDIEGFSPGGNMIVARGSPHRFAPDAMDRTIGINQRAADETIYQSLMGEVEARNAASRRAMSPEERRSSAPWDTQDTKFHFQTEPASGLHQAINRLTWPLSSLFDRLGIERAGSARAYDVSMQGLQRDMEIDAAFRKRTAPAANNSLAGGAGIGHNQGPPITAFSNSDTKAAPALLAAEGQGRTLEMRVPKPIKTSPSKDFPDQPQRPFELNAEAIRAYLTNPNYLKTVDPGVAAHIRKQINDNPSLNHLIQFNANGDSKTAPLALLSAGQGEDLQRPGLPQMASFAGERSSMADADALARAKTMFSSGADRSSIHRETGWHINPAGQWRYEIDDSTAKAKDISPTDARPLADVVDHPALFKAYPALKSTNVTIEDRPTLDGGHLAEYDPRTNHMWIAGKRSVGSLLSTILHEAQHGIQSIEGDVDANAMQKPDARGLLERALKSKKNNEASARTAGNATHREVMEDEARMRAELRKYLDMNREATAAYVNNPSENEAFAVSSRIPLTAAQRRSLPPWQSHLQSWPLLRGAAPDVRPEWSK